MGRLHRARWGHSIQRYADDELVGVSAERLLAHLAGCPGCTSELAVVQRLKASLARVGERRPPELAVTRLRAEASRIVA